MKLFSRGKFIVFLVLVFTFMFSSAALAANYYPNSYYTNYYKYYTPQTNTYNYSYQTQANNYNYNYWNWDNGYQKTPTNNQEKQEQIQEPTPTPVPTPETAPTTGLSADEQKMINLVNQERTTQGLEPLQVDMQLVKLARMKSQDMIDNNYFSHTSPTYGSPFEMMKNNGVSYRYAGENIAGASQVTTAHTNLMNSDGHRKNILSENYTHIGIGIVNGGKYGKMYTQLFIGK